MLEAEKEGVSVKTDFDVVILDSFLAELNRGLPARVPDVIHRFPTWIGG